MTGCRSICLLVVIGLSGLAAASSLHGQPLPEPLRDLISRAQAAEQADNLEEATRLYERILEIRPGWTAAQLNLGLVYYSQRRYPQAVRLLTEVLEADASLASAYLFRGASYYQLDQYAKALESLEHYLALQPDSDEVRSFLAGSYYGLKDYRNAALQYLQQLRFMPRDPELYFHLGESLVSLAGEAVKSLEDDPDANYFSLLVSAAPLAEKDEAAAQAKIREAIRLKPRNPEGHLALGNVRMKQGRLGEARTHFAEALQGDPYHCRALQGLADAELALASIESSLRAAERAARLWPACLPNPVPEKLGLVDTDFEQRLQALRKHAAEGEWQAGARLELLRLTSDEQKDGLAVLGSASNSDAALRRCREVVAARVLSTPSERPLMLASCLEIEGDLRAAGPTLIAAQSRGSEDPKLRYLASKIYLRLAQRSFGALATLAPKSHLLARLRAQAFENSGELERAEVEYKSAIELAGSSVDSLVTYGEFKCRIGQFEGAMPILERVLERAPSHPRASSLLGEVHLSAGRLDSALPLLRGVVGANPADKHSRMNLAKTLYRLDQLDEAISVLEHAPADSDGSLHFLLGNYYRARGDKEQAIRALRVYEKRRQKVQR